jgi:Reverse transcriptase (RNA-dependent DNA polymerase)
MNNRSFRVAVGSTLSDPMTIENGVIQGAVLSVTLFLVAMSGITKKIKSPVKILGYADDWVVYTKHRTLKYAQNALQKAMKSIETWAEDAGFTMSAEKTAVMHFTRRKKKQQNIVLKLYGRQLEVVDTHTILGLTFDKRLNWKSHIQKVKAKPLKGFQFSNVSLQRNGEPIETHF